MEKKKGFSGSIGFVLAAAGSAVGVGNIWRFPYLAAKDGGGVFLLVYMVLLLTLGFTLLTTDVAIGRKTKSNSLKAYGRISKKWNFLGIITFVVPLIIMSYYSVIGGWILKYSVSYLNGMGPSLSEDGYFGSFISKVGSPVIYNLIFLAFAVIIVFRGVEKGIEKFSKIIMPGLIMMILCIAIYTLRLEHVDGEGVKRTAIEGFKLYLVPNFDGMSVGRFFQIVVDAMSQIFFSLSVSMGIMITFGSYVKDDVNLGKSIAQIEFFDSFVALLSGAIIIPAIYVFSGTSMLSCGPGLMFVSLPKVFAAMGYAGKFIAPVFFVMVLFAALTSCVSILETVVANFEELFGFKRENICISAGIIYAVLSTLICFGYNILYIELPLPNGSYAQLLDLMDYISNSFLMPFIAFLSCIFIGHIVKPDFIINEMERDGSVFRRKRIYRFVIRNVAPVFMLLLFLESSGIIKL